MKDKVLCNKCGKGIDTFRERHKKRTNYPMGKKSKPIRSYLCDKCRRIK